MSARSSGRRERRTGSSSPPTSTARARRSPGTSPRRPALPAGQARPGDLQRDHRAGDPPRVRPSRAQINRDLVDAQQARRIVDRLVGYTLSPLLSRKVRSGLSAGRVQSVAVRLVVEREREIRAFVAREYWTIVATPRRPGRRRRSMPTSSGSTARSRRSATAPRPTRTSGPCGRAARSSPRSATKQEQAQPGAAVHDLDAPAGGQPQARLQPEAHDGGRPAALRGRRRRRRARSG